MQSWDLKTIETPGGSRSPVVLHSEDEGRAVLVALEGGRHQVKEHAWVLVADGSVAVDANGTSLDAGAGTLLHFEPDERHAISARDGGARLLLVLVPWPGEGHYRDA